jgi:hypothetical protein
MQIIPLQPTPSQVLEVTLGGQPCLISVYQKFYGIFVDLYNTNKIPPLIIGGVIAQNLNRIVRDDYLGFIGDLAFYDTQGNSDPTYQGLGSQFLLLYIEETDQSQISVT